MNEYYKKFLNEIELAEVTRFADNKTLLHAVKKLLLSRLYFTGVLQAGEEPDFLRNFALKHVIEQGKIFTNEQLGAILRAQGEMVNDIEGAFQELENFSTKVEEKEEEKNKAR